MRSPPQIGRRLEYKKTRSLSVCPHFAHKRSVRYRYMQDLLCCDFSGTNAWLQPPDRKHKEEKLCLLPSQRTRDDVCCVEGNHGRCFFFNFPNCNATIHIFLRSHCDFHGLCTPVSKNEQPSQSFVSLFLKKCLLNSAHGHRQPTLTWWTRCVEFQSHFQASLTMHRNTCHVKP